MMNGHEYTMMMLHRQRQAELLKEAQENHLARIAQDAARRVREALRGDAS